MSRQMKSGQDILSKLEDTNRAPDPDATGLDLYSVQKEENCW